MAKNDYSVIVFKILTYLYSCLIDDQIVDDRILSPDSPLFKAKGFKIKDGYWNKIIKMMSDDGLITGLQFIKTWGSGPICISDFSECQITSKGIDYLENNSGMKKVFEALQKAGDLIVPIATAVLGMINTN